MTLVGDEHFINQEFQDAITQYQKALLTTKIPSNVMYIYNRIAMCYSQLGQPDKCIEYFEKITKIKNDIPAIHKNLHVLYCRKRMYKKALDCIMEAFRLQPSDEVYQSLGNVYFYMKEYKKSLFFYKKVTPNDSTGYNMSFVYLAMKDFRQGWELYEMRLKSNEIDPQTNQITRVSIPTIPMWNGQPCKELLVVYEQGIGDNILYFRFVLDFAKRYPDTNITYFVRQQVKYLFTSPIDNVTIVSDAQPFNITKFDRQMYVMSLPYFLNVDRVCPTVDKYITTNDELLSRWKITLNVSIHRPKVGFFYKGLLTSFIEKQMDLEAFEPLSKLDIDLISLHKKDEIEKDLDNVAFADQIKCFDIDTKDAFQDSIEILRCLDLFITIDTSMVHLAGALGIKTFLMLGYGSDWRWFNDDVCHWYDSVEIYRMTENKHLNNIMPRVQEAVDELFFK